MTIRIALALTLSATALSGCAGGLGGGNLAPAGEVQPRAITQEDRAQGAQANTEFLAEFGGAYDGSQAAYVRGVGQKIAVQSGIAADQSAFTINLLNSPVTNAFAIPGGYVYITRGLTGLLNNEAELAFVLGHEVGHVAAAHSRARQSRSQTTGLLGVLGQVASGILLGNGALGQAVGQGIGTVAQGSLLGFSRAQEYQADDLGILYLQRANYDPYASATSLASLAMQNDLDARERGDNRTLPEWASTHPDPAARVQRARERAQATTPPGATVGSITNRDGFLSAIDNMLYEDDPQQGVVRGERFLHPVLRFQFTAPQGFTLANGTSAVTVSGQSGRAELQGGGAVSSGQLDAYVGRVLQGLGGSIQPGAIQRTTINGLPAAVSVTTAQTQQGNVDVGVVAYSLNGQGYHFLTLAQAGQGLGPFGGMVQSFAPLSTAEANAIRAKVIDVVTVRSGDTASSLSQRMAYDDAKLDRFLVLNGLGRDTGLQAGQKVKLVVYR